MPKRYQLMEERSRSGIYPAAVRAAAVPEPHLRRDTKNFPSTDREEEGTRTSARERVNAH
jgi:hypothetical protein